MERSNDQIATAMLAMAETFRTMMPIKVKMAVKCARGALKLPNVSSHVSAHIHLQLGKLLALYTENYDEARDNLETAYGRMMDFGEYLMGFRLEAVQLLCEVYVHGISSQANSLRICQLIRYEMPFVKDNPPILAKFLFYYIEASCNAGLPSQAIECCDLGISTFQNREVVFELYFRITKALIFMREHETTLSDSEHDKIRELLGTLDPKSLQHQNCKLYYDCIQLVLLLHEGKTRSARVVLRNVQVECQSLTRHIESGIRWSDPAALTAFTCCMTVINAAYQCGLERTNKYFQLVVRHVNEYLTKAAKSPIEHGILRCVQRTRLIANEFAAHIQMMACKPNDALNNMKDMLVFSAKLGPYCDLGEQFHPILQNLLGLYCIYLRDFDRAERHFKAALAIRPNPDKNTYIMVNTNLCLLYLTQCKHAEYYSVAELLVPNRVDPCTMIIRANVKVVQAFHMFLLNKVNEFRSLSEDALNYAKLEDIFRLHNLVIMICSQCFPVTVDALNSCINWSSKGSDYMMLHWGNTMISKLKQAKGEDTTESDQAAEMAKQLIKTVYIQAIHEEHQAKNLINWYEGDPSDFG